MKYKSLYYFFEEAATLLILKYFTSLLLVTKFSERPCVPFSVNVEDIIHRESRQKMTPQTKSYNVFREIFLSIRDKYIRCGCLKWKIPFSAISVGTSNTQRTYFIQFPTPGKRQQLRYISSPNVLGDETFFAYATFTLFPSGFKMWWKRKRLTWWFLSLYRNSLGPRRTAHVCLQDRMAGRWNWTGGNKYRDKQQKCKQNKWKVKKIHYGVNARGYTTTVAEIFHRKVFQCLAERWRR